MRRTSWVATGAVLVSWAMGAWAGAPTSGPAVAPSGAVEESAREIARLKIEIKQARVLAEAMRDQIAAAREGVIAAQKEVAAVRERLAAVERENQTLRASVTGTRDERVQAMFDRLDEQTKQSDELLRQNTALKTQMQKLTADLERMAKQDQSHREMIVELRHTMDLNEIRARNGAPPVPAPTPASAPAVPPAPQPASTPVTPTSMAVPEAHPTTTTAPAPAQTITGAVAGVRDDMVSIDVGSDRGVRAHMKFDVLRGQEKIGTLLVEIVTPSQAAGTVSDRTQPPAVGDRVVSSGQ